MRNKLSGRYEMLQMTSRFDGLPDFLLRRLKENEFVKGKPIIQITFNFQSMWNCIIIKSSLGRLRCACEWVSECECLPHLWDIKWQYTHAHEHSYRKREREKEKNCWTFRQYKISLWTRPLQTEICVQMAHFEWWTLQKQMHFSMWKVFVCAVVCVCMLPTGNRSTT